MIPSHVTTLITIESSHSARVWHARLPNGRPVTAFRDRDESLPDLQPGDQVRAELSVSDFSQAHILD